LARTSAIQGDRTTFRLRTPLARPRPKSHDDQLTTTASQTTNHAGTDIASPARFQRTQNPDADAKRRAMSSPGGNLEQEVKYEARGAVAIITLNLPHKLNAVTQAHYFRIASLLHQIAADDAITVTVLTGTGRFFSAYAACPAWLLLLLPDSSPPTHFPQLSTDET